MLVTPRVFQKNPSSRLYGSLMREYRHEPKSLERDLPHRKGLRDSDLASRIGWITWEDIKGVNAGSCPWLDGKAGP